MNIQNDCNSMTDKESRQDKQTYISLVQLINTGVKISILATAIEKHGIQGWDRFGRFKAFTKDSAGDDALRYTKVLDALAAQHEWDEAPANYRSPIEEAEAFAGSGHPFEYGWLKSELPDFEAIVAGAAGQPVAPPKKPSKRAETSDLNIIAALLQFLMPKAGYAKEAQLINDLLDVGWGDYAGISQRNLQQRFADAKKSLNQ